MKKKSNLNYSIESLCSRFFSDPTFIEDKNGYFRFNKQKFQTMNRLTIRSNSYFVNQDLVKSLLNLIHFGNKKVMIKSRIYK